MTVSLDSTDPDIITEMMNTVSLALLRADVTGDVVKLTFRSDAWWVVGDVILEAANDGAVGPARLRMTMLDNAEKQARITGRWLLRLKIAKLSETNGRTEHELRAANGLIAKLARHRKVLG